MVVEISWTKDVLINHIENHSYEKYLLNQTNFDATIPEQYREQAKLAVKDQYMFDFMELSDEHSERELEQGLISNVREFLSEMGGTFTFIGNQYHVKVDNEDFYIDLLLFHRKLNCLMKTPLLGLAFVFLKMSIINTMSQLQPLSLELMVLEKFYFDDVSRVIL